MKYGKHVLCVLLLIVSVRAVSFMNKYVHYNINIMPNCVWAAKAILAKNRSILGRGEKRLEKD